jgi:hypothetical protein
VLAVFNGHLHFYNEAIINNIKYVTVPSLTENNGAGKPFMQYVSVITDGKDISYSLEEIDLASR